MGRCTLCLYSRGVHVKQSFLTYNTLQAVYEDSVILQRMLQTYVIILQRMLQQRVLQNSSLNFKIAKPENVTHFINVKG